MPNQDDGESDKQDAQREPLTSGESRETAAVEPVEASAPPVVPDIKQENGSKNLGRPERQDHISKKTLVDRIKRSDRWMIGLTAVIAVGGIVSALIFGWQLHVMQGQLDAMEADGRPWVKADIEVPTDFITRGDGGAGGNFRFKIQNVGKSPALDVNAWPILINHSIVDSSVDDLLKKHCDDAANMIGKMPMIAWGNILFPGDSDQIQEFASIDTPKKKSELLIKPTEPSAPSASQLVTPGINTMPNNSFGITINPPSDTMALLNPQLPKIPPHLLLLTCVIYKSAESPTFHQTGESLYLVEKSEPDSSDGWMEIDISKKQAIPVDRLKLMRPQFEWRKYAN